MEKITNEVVEFTMENILSGAFATAHGSSKGASKVFEGYASLRLLEESGQVLSDSVRATIVAMPYKWFFYKKLSDNNNGNIIITFHTKKAPKEWIYATIDTQTGSVMATFKTIQDAKQSLK